MGYDGAMRLASIVLFIPVLVIAAVAVLILRKFAFVPKGPRGLLALPLLILWGYSILLSWSAFEMLILYPTILQRDYLGAAYGTPLSLRFYEHNGFQDPMDEWRYRLSAEDTRTLRRRCLPEPAGASGTGDCTLYLHQDGTSSATVGLRRDELRITEALF